MKRKFLVLASLLSSLFVVTACADEPRYEIIIDAGSTGSRLHLFQTDIQNAFPHIQDKFSESAKPGLSSFPTDPQATLTAVKKLLDDAIVQLNKNQIDPRTVTINIMATAGMRLLAPETQQTIYALLRLFIEKNYTFHIGQIETISGKMEGIYGWLDVNYLNQTFQNHTPTVGSIDLGGASTQIAFTTSDTSKVDDEITLLINQQKYTVFSKSFLGLGQDQALAAINQDPLAAACYPAGYQMNGLVGNFDLNSCQTAYVTLLQNKQVVNEILPTSDQHFVAYSGAYYDLNFLGLDKTPNAALIENKIKAICGVSWDALQASHPDIPTKFLAPACANDTYVSTLLFWAYSLKDEQLDVANTINGQDIDWTLGAELFKSLGR